ncbi:hypothetical protein NDU88_006077 [Pleurodeles waltl]|uniref:Uncharacterized protein n=1 Tax=Pleurodeles waltl TaxID=8319 RepID=A0AAV7QHZ9_PLEWA|nr:hypothetical protein NDU88_006077 [Pleurodeles waltl]
MQKDIEAPVGSGRLAPGNSGAPADDFRSGPGRGWRPSPDGPMRRGGALLSRRGGTLMRGAARAPGGLPSCLPGWLECCRGGPGPGPPSCPDPRAQREERSGGRGPRRSADLDRRTGGGSGPVVAIPSVHD